MQLPPAAAAAVAVRVSGVVQGVGFRPHVHRLAGELGLSGRVGNDAAGVFIELHGPAAVIDDFLHRLSTQAPPLARVTGIEITSLAAGVTSPDAFEIVATPAGGTVATSLPPDVGICADCRRELFDPADRRFGHPFITCTNCGPRYTIVLALPYDRPATTMAGFPMCPACQAEYDDPTDRRFHAQPIACPDCGPVLRYEPVDAGAGGPAAVAPAVAPAVVGSAAALAAARRCLRTGGVVAVKGVGGYHLAVDATSTSAVQRLRTRKQREHKPFAVMVADLEQARRVVELDDVEVAALTSPQRPVLLARRTRGDGVVAGPVAPGNPLLGVMLPSSPLHELLLAAGPDPVLDPVPPVLVMTSGNLSGEPICFDDDDARTRLGPLIDGLLTHDRPIHVPCDDGVVRVVDGEVLPLRRSRGDAPLPLELTADAPPCLALGAELKNTIGVARGRHAWLSQHLGDLGDLETLRSFERTTRRLAEFFEVEPVLVAADPHPAYATHAWARRHHAERLITVQHHHAHVAALLAEHGLAPEVAVLGIAFDGTGYGTDGTVWGGEVLLADQRGFERLTHLARVPLPGGDSAVTNPARMALAHLWAAGIDWDPDLPAVAALDDPQRRLLRSQLERDVACIPTSSMGRLFDAVSALIGVCQHVTYEGQAAIELEWCTDPARLPASHHLDVLTSTARYAFEVGALVDPAPVLRAIVDDLRAGVPIPVIAVGFHDAVADAVVEVAQRCAERVAPAGAARTVGLTGGVFQNAWLTTRTRARLERQGWQVLTHRLVPPNDGGLALGQLAVLAARHPPTT